MQFEFVSRWFRLLELTVNGKNGKSINYKITPQAMDDRQTNGVYRFRHILKMKDSLLVIMNWMIIMDSMYQTDMNTKQSDERLVWFE